MAESINNLAVIIITPLHLPEVGNIMFIPQEPSITRAYSSKYNAEQVYGKMDPIVTFQNVTRQLKFDFQVKPMGDATPETVTDIARNLNLLASSLYPRYTADAPGSPSIIKAPPFFRIRYDSMVGNFGNGLEQKGLTGYITNLDIGTRKASENWAQGTRFRILPRTYDIRFDFNVVHERKMGWYQDGFAGGTNLDFDSGPSARAQAIGEAFGRVAAAANRAVASAVQTTTDNIEEVVDNATAAGQELVGRVEEILSGDND